ncbi:MAG: hydrolase [Actinobacteria bacterium]|nr:hydrolase [Actinomycetota bacterium]
MPRTARAQRCDPPYPCPACGHLAFPEIGAYDVCPTCGWQDDESQLRFALTVGANRMNLLDAQRSVRLFGVVDRRLVDLPTGADGHVAATDPDWRPIDNARDVEVAFRGVDYGASYPADRTRLYYWRDTFWRH